MSQEVVQNELKAKTQQLMDGPLKHIKAAVLAAALLPLASVAATPASAQQVSCASGGIVVCGYVFNDVNNNGFWDDGESGIAGVKVTLCDGTDCIETETGLGGLYSFPNLQGGTVYTVAAQIPTGTQASPPNAVSDDSRDSDGEPDSNGFSAATLVSPNGYPVDFGFHRSTALNPGTGTPGYWKNHPEAWPKDQFGVPVTIMIGGVPYSKTAGLTGLAKITKDKTTTMFSSLLSAKLNLLIGNDGSCLIGTNGDTIALADKWMTAPPIGYGPLGSGIAASSYAWSIGEPLHQTLDNYNNGLLCVPHRQ
jgi:hypothetical protein